MARLEDSSDDDVPIQQLAKKRATEKPAQMDGDSDDDLSLADLKKKVPCACACVCKDITYLSSNVLAGFFWKCS